MAMSVFNCNCEILKFPTIHLLKLDTYSIANYSANIDLRPTCFYTRVSTKCAEEHEQEQEQEWEREPVQKEKAPPLREGA